MDRVRRFVEVMTSRKDTAKIPAFDVFNVPVVARYLSLLERDGKSTATQNRALSAILVVWTKAHRLGLLLSAPPSGLYQRESRGRRRTLSINEEQRLLEALAEPYRSLAALLSLTGLRVSEALALTWADLLFPAKGGRMASVVVRDSKNGDARSVPVDEELLRLALLAVGGIAKNTGPFSHVSQSAFNHAWAAARAAMGLADDREFVPHALRHTYATRLVVAGVPLAVVARLMGHRSVRTTFRYQHVSDHDAAAWVARVSESGPAHTRSTGPSAVSASPRDPSTDGGSSPSVPSTPGIPVRLMGIPGS